MLKFHQIETGLGQVADFQLFKNDP